MPVPSNTTDATALVIDSLPYLNTQQVDDGATTYTVWYKYTAVLGTLDINISPTNVNPSVFYAPRVKVWVGTPGSLTAYLSIVSTEPIQVPVAIAQDYFFEISDVGVGSPEFPAVLQLAATAAPRNPVLANYLLINDDSPGFPGVIVGPDGTVQNMAAPMPAGEGGDVLATGEILLNDFNTDTLHFFDNQLNPTTQINIGNGDPRIRVSQGLQHFYVGWKTGATTHIRSYDGAGVEQTAISTTGISSLFGFAPNTDGTILYYSENQNNSALKRWDLIGNSALSDLYAATLGWFIADILVLSDGTIVSSFVQPFLGNSHVRIHDAAGTLLDTFDAGTDTYPAGTFPRLAFAADDPSSVWVWTHPSTGISRFQHVRVSDLAVLTLIDDVVEFETGIYQPTTPDLAAFGVSFSCPFVVLRVAITATNGGTLFVTPDLAVIGPLIWVEWPRRIPDAAPEGST